MESAEREVYGHLEGLDIAVIAVYLIGSVIIGLMFARRGSKDPEAYFVGGRGMPWWLIGISLAATCFAADTPLWVGDMIYRRGIEGTWMHWVTGIGFAFYVFVIAPLWRKSHIITDLEFLELRYSGWAARVMRMANSIYYSLFFNVMMMGVSTLSITTIMQATTGMDKGYAVIIVMSGAVLYCAIAGLWGVAATDFMQFFVTFLGSAVLAWFAVSKVGGLDALVTYLHADTAWPGHELNVLPGRGAAAGLPLLTILYLVMFRWWDNAAIGAYVSQRLFAARSIKHATLGAMLHGLIYWSVVPLPWIITICAARKYMPNLEYGQEAYPRMAMAVLPTGLKGVLVASMLAAFMSTYSALLSWGSSYAVNDCYRRFLVRGASDKHYVRAGQLFMIPMAIISGLIAYQAESIFNLLIYLFMIPAATWTVMVLRWLWWRVNAWSEVAALLSGIVLTVVMALAYFYHDAWVALVGADSRLSSFSDWMSPLHNEEYFGHKFLFIVVISSVVWLAVTFLTKPVESDRLDAFLRKVNPPGFWGPVRARTGLAPHFTWGGIFYGWAVMLIGIFGPLVGLIKLFFGEPREAFVILAVGVVGIVLAVHKAMSMDDEDDASPAVPESIAAATADVE